MEKTFTEIYSKNKWGGGSGTGSNMSRNNKKYMDLLNNFMNNKEYKIKSICDIGCGDWKFSQYMDFSKFKYLGIDCVESVINENKEKFQKKNINFLHKSVEDDFIPEGYDLIILKDVIQHWTDDDIMKYLPKILDNNKYVFITNGYRFMRDPSKNSLMKRNINNQYKYHPVDIKKQPLCKFKEYCLQTEEYFSKQMNLFYKPQLLSIN